MCFFDRTYWANVFANIEFQSASMARALSVWVVMFLFRFQMLWGAEPLPIQRLETYRKSSQYYLEPFRPSIHFTPEIYWTNDPNGMVYHDGEYHLFYQHNPHGIDWGHMSWGHAVSSDMFHWRHLPIALHDEHGIMAFSGSAVFDEKNTSDFGQNGQGALVAIYTGHGLGRQTQDLAYSNDRGRTWTKYEGNPVLDLGLSEFRDPKVFWHAASNAWSMVVSLAVEKRLLFYSSPNLKEWTKTGEFGPAGVSDKPNWECPDLFELPIENEPGQKRWVLVADMGNGAVAGGSGCEYFVGHFDGRAFHAESSHSQWVDYGRDFYAAASWNQVPEKDGRRLWLAWMNNWSSAGNPTHPWRGAMTLPRHVTLRRMGETLRLCQMPPEEIKGLYGRSHQWSDDSATRPIALSAGQRALDISCEWDAGRSKEFGVSLGFGGKEKPGSRQLHIRVGYDASRQTVFVDGIPSPELDQAKGEPKVLAKTEGPLTPADNSSVKLRMVVDASSLEVFAGEGETVLTNLMFVPHPLQEVRLFNDGDARLIRADLHELKPSMGSHQ